MFKRKLLALDHPTADNFDSNNEQEYRSLVVWLEDQKIRLYKIEDRSALKQVDTSTWVDAYTQYQVDLASPVSSKSPCEQLEWLLGYAVKLEYADNVEKYRSTSEDVKIVENVNTPKVITENSLDDLDFYHEDFKNGVNSLAKLLNITCHPDHLITLKAVSKVIGQRLSSDALANPNKIIVRGTPFPFQEADLGFDTGDYVLNQAAKILRLLYIHDMRDLQTKINESIVAVQKITANPKTNTALGKVGK